MHRKADKWKESSSQQTLQFMGLQFILLSKLKLTQLVTYGLDNSPFPEWPSRVRRIDISLLLLVMRMHWPVPSQAIDVHYMLWQFHFVFWTHRWSWRLNGGLEGDCDGYYWIPSCLFRMDWQGDRTPPRICPPFIIIIYSKNCTLQPTKPSAPQLIIELWSVHSGLICVLFSALPRGSRLA